MSFPEAQQLDAEKALEYLEQTKQWPGRHLGHGGFPSWGRLRRDAYYVVPILGVPYFL